MGDLLTLREAAARLRVSADERHVRMAARLYEMRDAARLLLGDRYAAEMQKIGQALSQVAAETKREPLAVAIEAAKDGTDAARCCILAAVVELTEKSRA